MLPPTSQMSQEASGPHPVHSVDAFADLDLSWQREESVLWWGRGCPRLQGAARSACPGPGEGPGSPHAPGRNRTAAHPQPPAVVPPRAELKSESLHHFSSNK